MKIETLLVNGKVWINNNFIETNIAISDGTIVGFGDNFIKTEDCKIIDAKGNIILPGGIDAHTHCEDGTVEEREDFFYFTRACAASGITTAFVMPTPGITVNCKDRFNKRVEMLNKRAYVDYGLFGGAGTDNIEKISELAEAGVIGFKTFCCKPEWEDEDTEGCCSFNNGSLLDIMKEVKKTGKMHALHVQDLSITQHSIEKSRKAGRNDIKAFIESLEPIVETSGVASVLAIANYVNIPIHFCHICYEDSFELIKEAKERNQDVTCEALTCVLDLTTDAIYDQYPYILWYPLPGSEKDKEAVYNCIQDGTLDMINSDHSPFTKKELEDSVKQDIFGALPGGTNLEVTLPLLLNKVNEGILNFKQVVDLFMVNPAKRFGIYPKKGALQIGSDADLIIVDMEKEKTFKEGEHFVKTNYTQFDGCTFKGVPVITMVRGNIIMENGKIVGSPGYGRVIKTN